MTRATTSFSVTMNGASFTSQTEQLDPLLHYHITPGQHYGDLSGCPNMLDTFADYAGYYSYPGSGAGQAVGQSGGMNRSALSQGWQGSQEGRGGFPVVITGHTPVAAVVNFVSNEPLLFSPFEQLFSDAPGITGITSIQTSLSQFNFSRMWSHDNTSPFSSRALTFVGIFTSANMSYRFLTPFSGTPLPRQLVYPLNQVNFMYVCVHSFVCLTLFPCRTSTASPNIASGAAFSMISNQQILPTVPKKIFISVQQVNSARSHITSDTFAGITSLTLNFGSKNGMLSNAQQIDLFAICKRNGKNSLCVCCL